MKETPKMLYNKQHCNSNICCCHHKGGCGCNREKCGKSADDGVVDPLRETNAEHGSGKDCKTR